MSFCDKLKIHLENSQQNQPQLTVMIVEQAL
ncbi:Uncharacterised protein [Raoultella ornithinolytica]|nr:Uncharacterised protein [Raoultella ornithinolytica]